MALEADIQPLLARGELEPATKQVLESLGPGIFGYLCSLLEEDDAKEVFSMFAEDLWRGLTQFRGEASLRTWSYRLAWHAACRFRRDAFRKRRESIPTSAASRLAASVASHSGMAPGSRRERLARLRAALAPDEQTLLVLRVDRELEWEEIAEILSDDAAPVTSPALRKRFERLKEKLAELARTERLID
jgi:RNA polymerase sigma-70 factor (ECF subfamily)